MTKTILAVTTAFVLMSGASFAETSYSSTSTHTNTTVPAPMLSNNTDSSTTVKRTENSDGVMVEKDKTVTSTPSVTLGDTTVSHKKTETTTVR